MSGIPLRLILALLLALGCAGPALAQRWNIDPSIEAQATLTNNANYDVGAQREGDLIFNVLPAVGFSREGPRLRVAGTASLNVIWLCRRCANQPRVAAGKYPRQPRGDRSVVLYRGCTACQPVSIKSLFAARQMPTRRSTSTPMCRAGSRRICKAISGTTGVIWCAAITRIPIRPKLTRNWTTLTTAGT